MESIAESNLEPNKRLSIEKYDYCVENCADKGQIYRHHPSETLKSGFKCAYTCIRIKSHEWMNEWMHNLSFHLTFNCIMKRRYKSSRYNRHSPKLNIERRAVAAGGAQRGDRRIANFESLCFVIILSAAKILLKQNMCAAKRMFVSNTIKSPMHSAHTHTDNPNHHSHDDTTLLSAFISCVRCSRVLLFLIYWIESAYCVIFWKWICEKTPDSRFVIWCQCWTQHGLPTEMNLHLFDRWESEREKENNT